MRSFKIASGRGTRDWVCVSLILVLLTASGCRWENYVKIQSIDHAGEGRVSAAHMTTEEKAAYRYRRELIRKRHTPPKRQIETHYRCGLPEEGAKSLKGTALSGLDIDTLLARLIRVMKVGTPKSALKFESTPGVMYAWTFHYTLAFQRPRHQPIFGFLCCTQHKNRKPGTHFKQLDEIAYGISDNEAARQMNEARQQLFKAITELEQIA